MPIDLCIDARMAFSSGIGTCIRQLVPFFNEPPFRVTLLTDQGEKEWCKSIEQIPFRAPIYSIKEQLYFPLKVPRCDLFWSPHYNVPILPIRAKKRIVTIHDVCHLVFGNFSQRTYAKCLMHRALLSDAVITSSFFSKNEISLHLKKNQKNLRVIPVGVNCNQFQRILDPTILKTVQKKYQLPDQFILYVGNSKPHKNLAGLLNAFHRISLPGLALVIVGKCLETSPRIRVLGSVSEKDLPVLYSMATVFAFPSFYEGFGLPPLEAMGCGCPTVVSRAASLSEVCGPASLYIDPNNPEQIAHAMEQIVNSEKLRVQLTQKGYDRVKEFPWEKTALHYRNLFEEVHRA